MASAAESNMNFSALKMVDSCVKEILNTAAHVAVYSFNSDSHEWERTNVEGALFLYCRTVDPKYSMLVMNRLNTTNLLETVDEGFEVQLKQPFLLYKNVDGRIRGIWFYDSEDCVTIDNSVRRILQTVVVRNAGPNSKVGGTPSAETNKRVMDFFAKASSKTPLLKSGGLGVTPPVRHDLSDVQPLLKRLLSASNAVPTVEEIEKKHQQPRKGGGTGVGLDDRHDRIAGVAETAAPPSTQNGFNYLKMNDGGGAAAAGGGGGTPVVTTKLTPQKLFQNSSNLRSSSSPPNSVQRVPSDVEVPPLEGGTTSVINSNKSTTSSAKQHFFPASLSQPSVPCSDPIEVSVLERTVIETPPKPALLPPTVFATPRSSEETSSTVITSSSSSSARPTLEPLTKTQLLQAVSYLLKNDADFINKLHEAYVKSFVDMVS